MIYRLAALLTLAAGACAQDPAFPEVLFDQWLQQPAAQTHFEWSVRVSGGRLTSFQRLLARVDITVDGNEIVKRKGRGELRFFVQFTGSDRRTFQTHGSYDLKNVRDEAAKSKMVYSQTAFAVAGDYRVDIAIQDSENGDHATLTRSLHVNPLKSDPLPNADRSLPLIEFHTSSDAPDSWFQPDSTGVLNLPIQTKRPIRVELLANSSPSVIGPRARPGRMSSRNLSAILPAMKAFWQMNLSLGKLGTSLIDVNRRQVLFTQEHEGPPVPLDWLRLRPGLVEANPNKIDVRELTDRHTNPQFFVEEVRKRLGPQTALIILTGPMTFTGSDDRRPIEIDPQQAGSLFYIRFHAVQPRLALPEDSVDAQRRNRRADLPSPRPAIEPYDSLAELLKPLKPRTLDVYTPEGARKALAAIMREIGQM